MRIIIIWLQLLYSSPTEYLNHRLSYIEDIEYQILYEGTISYIKECEGFRENWYDDRGYKAIGYGQRGVFFKRKITSPITKEEADSILRESFAEHEKLVKFFYPELNKIQLLAITHLSYCAGIGKIRRNQLISDNTLNETKLLKFSGKKRRQFEINLFNHGKYNCVIRILNFNSKGST